MRNKTSRDSLARVFPRLIPVTCISNSDWIVAMFTSAVIAQSDYAGFDFMTLDTEQALPASNLKIEAKNGLSKYESRTKARSLKLNNWV